jgi:hypothetical protein
MALYPKRLLPCSFQVFELMVTQVFELMVTQVFELTVTQFRSV